MNPYYHNNQLEIYLRKIHYVIYIDINCVKCFGEESNAMLINQKMKKMRIKLKKELNEDELKYIIHQNFYVYPYMENNYYGMLLL